MRFKWWLAFALIMMVPGCSTHKSEPVNVDSGSGSAAAPVIGPSEESLPVRIQFEMAGVNGTGARDLVVRVEPERGLLGDAVMIVEPEDGTQTNYDGNDEPLPELSKGQVAMRHLVLRGAHPAVGVKVVIKGDGFALMTQASWPEKQAPQQLGEDVMQALPAPIEINGVMVDRGVEVGN